MSDLFLNFHSLIEANFEPTDTSHLVFIILCLFIFNLILQSLEHFLTYKPVWSFNFLDPELKPFLSSKFIRWFLWSDLFYGPQLLIKLGLLALILLSSFKNWQLELISLSFLLHAIHLVRFRGNYNGGSDMMTCCTYWGLVVHFAQEKFNNFVLFSNSRLDYGLALLGFFVVGSYFKAGISKVTKKEWQNGFALKYFLKKSLHKKVRQFFLNHENTLNTPLAVVGYGVIVFELFVVCLFFLPTWVSVIYMGCALSFHFINFLIFGLNRFFWSWLCAWPALLYLISRLSVKGAL